ncbi:arabinofuranosidase [Archangium minus]|uniref:Arabinofuranosidase n=1 Tax=Archangium minus TaxID=83450 RepID=A0ABY9WP01_9BACT|nr:arabinofuranosidase [Archangium minus]
MRHFKSSRIARMLSLVAAVSLTGCVIEDSHDPSPGVPGVQTWCRSLEGSSSGVIPLWDERGSFLSLESYAFPGYYIRHSGGRGVLSVIVSDRDEDEATFRIVPGLADDRCISFEARSQPGSYLTQDDTDVVLAAWRSDPRFLEDATFCPRPGLADSDHISFESCSYRGEFINQYEGLLFVNEGYGWEYEEDATFTLDYPWSP